VARIAEQSYEVVGVDTLTTHPQNAQQGDIGAIHTSIETNDFYGTIVVQKSTKWVIAGNHRLIAARQAGLSQVPVVFVDVDDERALKMMVADNRTTELATRDEQALADILTSLNNTPEGLVGSGYDGDDLENLLFDLGNGFDPNGSGSASDPEPTLADEAQAKWLVEIGDTFSGQGITLTCGDARDESSYSRMDSDASVLWTDPPYGVDYAGKTKDALKIKGDACTEDELRSLLVAAFDAAFTRLSAGGGWYVAAPPGPLHLVFLESLFTRGLRQTLIWQKQQFVMGRSDYHYKHEPILYGWKPGAAHTWTGGRKQTTLLEHDRPRASKEHPTMKPVSLVRQCLANHATKESFVLDPFCGSGTTLLAANQLGLRAHGIELDPKFAAVTLQRLEDAGISMERDPF